MFFPLLCGVIASEGEEFGKTENLKTNSKFWKCDFAGSTDLHPDCDCLSGSFTGGKFEFQCALPENVGNLLLEVQNAGKSFKLDCPCDEANPLNSSIYTYLKGVPTSNIKDITLDYCPFPYSNLHPFFGEHLNLSNIQKLIFQSCAPISMLPKKSLDDLSQLLVLNLRGNGLETLQDEIFKRQSKLLELWLENNNLQTINEHIFKTTPELKILNLSVNKIKQLETGALKNLRNLQRLYLQGNSLDFLPLNVFDSLVNLTYLDLSNNNISTLNVDTFRFNSKLKGLYLRQNSLQSLSADVFRYNAMLEDLSLSSNSKLSSLPFEIFSNLAMLKSLDLNFCGLVQLPSGIFQNLTRLITLNLSGNLLTLLKSESFSGLVNLESLNLSNNSLTFIEDDTFSDLKSLTTLRLSRNRLTTIEVNAFLGLYSLKTLLLQNNQLENVSSEAFRDLIKLENVDLSRNHLKFNEGIVHYEFGMRQSPLKSCINLKKINLSGNKIGDLFSDFVNMISLTNLDLSNNEMTRLAFGDLFVFTSDHITVDISNNKIKHFVFDLADSIDVNEFDSRKTVILDNNPLVCDDQGFFLALYMNRSMPGVKHSWNINSPNLLCDEPSPLRGVAPTKIDPSMFVGKCPNDFSPCDCFKRPFDKTVLLECQQRNLTEIPIRLPKSNGGYKIQMNLSSNVIDLEKTAKTLPQNCCADVTVLDLSSNGLNSSVFATIGWQNLHLLFPNLNRLNLRNNNFSTVPAEIAMLKEIENLTFELDGNPWICDCSNPGLLRFPWKRIGDFSSLTCTNTLLLSELSIEKVCPPANEASIYLIIGMPIITVAIFCIGLIIYRSRHTIRAWLYNHHLCLRCVVDEEDDEDGSGHIYDAFISYSHLDEKFVVEELVPQLENPPAGLPHYRLCLHYRDW